MFLNCQIISQLTDVSSLLLMRKQVTAPKDFLYTFRFEATFVFFSGTPVTQFLLPRLKSCQEILSKPLTTGQDCTCCLATLT